MSDRREAEGEADRLIGRDHECEQVGGPLGPGALATLVGLGGVGTSRPPFCVSENATPPDVFADAEPVTALTARGGRVAAVRTRA